MPRCSAARDCMPGRSQAAFTLGRQAACTIGGLCRTDLVVAAALVVFFLALSSPALALFPRVAICGRVTSFVDAAPPADRIVRLGTQEPRRLALGSQIPQIGQEICIWGIDVENKNPPPGDPAPKGITGYGIAPVASFGCASVIDTIAIWYMPGEIFAGVPDQAFLALRLSKPAGDGCVRIGVDAVGNPIAVVVPRAATSTPGPTSPSSPVRSLPNTSTLVDPVAR
jgi:hypothetical protein